MAAITIPTTWSPLCWYHHHVAIHQLGFTIDLDSHPTGGDSSAGDPPPAPQ
jgi:hypothetical protein